MIIKVLFQLFVLYLLYKLIFDFIIPVWNTTKDVKQKVANMQNKMNRQNDPKTQQSPHPQKHTKPSPEEDYIDFEEIK